MLRKNKQYIDHEKFIKIMKALGYYSPESNIGGICAGFSSMWEQAVQSENYHLFLTKDIKGIDLSQIKDNGVILTGNNPFSIYFVRDGKLITKKPLIALHDQSKPLTVKIKLNDKEHEELKKCVAGDQSTILRNEHNNVLLNRIIDRACLKGVKRGLKLFHEENKFIARLQMLTALTEDEIIKKLHEAKQKEQNKEKLSPEEEAILEVLPFFDSLKLYHNPQEHIGITGSPILQMEVDKLAEIAGSEMLLKKGGKEIIMPRKALIGDWYTLTQYFNGFAEIIEAHMKKRATSDLVVTIGSCNHRISLRYDMNKKKWVLLDANNKKLKMISHHPFISSFNMSPIVMNIMKAFKEPEVSAFSVMVTTSKEQSEHTLKEKLEQYNQKYGIKQHTEKMVSNLGVNLAYIAAICNDIQCLTYLINQGDANLNLFDAADKKTPLHFAIATENVALVALLAKNGANLDARDIQQRSPVHYAVIKNNPEILDLLGQLGANLELPDKNNLTPLELAIQSNHLQLIPIFKKHGIDLDKPCNEFAHTLIIRAIREKNINLVEVLIENKVDLRKTDRINRTPLVIAVEKEQWPIVTRLLLALTDKNDFAIKMIELVSHQKEIVQSFIDYVQKLDAPDDKKCAIIQSVLNGENALGIYLKENLKYSFKFFQATNGLEEIQSALAPILMSQNKLDKTS